MSDPANPLPPADLVVEDDYADAAVYLGGLKSWAANLDDLPPNDQIMVFTMYVMHQRNTSADFLYIFSKTLIEHICDMD